MKVEEIRKELLKNKWTLEDIDKGVCLSERVFNDLIEAIEEIVSRVELPVSLTCPYCDGKVELKDSSIIYNGKSFGNVYVCENYPKCDSFVGTHHGKTKPLGTLANARLRNKRKEAHSLYDQLWRGKNRIMSRGEAYRFMAKTLNVSQEQAHIGMLDYEQCKLLINEILRASSD